MPTSVAAKHQNPIGAPADQTEFYRHYFGYVVRFVIKYGGIKPQDAEDVANAIWVRLLARDVLGQFNPDHIIVHDGKRYPARFESYLAKMLDLYVRHYRTQQAKRLQREVYIDAEHDAGELFDLLTGGSTDVSLYDDIEEQLLVDSLTRYLRSVPKVRNSELDLERLFLCVVAHTRAFGEVKTRQLAEVFGVNDTLMRKWLKALAHHVRIGLSVPKAELTPKPVIRPFFGGVKVTLQQLEFALDTLARQPGNMIKQPLAKVKHPLAVCDYHGVADTYRDEHPEFVAAATYTAEKEAFMAALNEVIGLYYDCD